MCVAVVRGSGKEMESTNDDNLVDFWTLLREALKGMLSLVCRLTAVQGNNFLGHARNWLDKGLVCHVFLCLIMVYILQIDINRHYSW